MINRNALLPGQDIVLYAEGQCRHFIIGDAPPSDGGAVLCYEAVCDGVNGLLKEFYPVACASGVERVDNYLQSNRFLEWEWERFQSAQERYLTAIRLIAEVRQKSPEIETFIPYFEIYYGMSRHTGKGTVYLWTPGRKTYTLEQLCSDLRQDTSENIFYKLEQILCCVEELVGCIRILHQAGLVMQDIKPSNIGYFMRGDRVREQMISLFDFDSVCNMNDINAPLLRVGTDGFTEPQTNIPCDCRTDIYSIGAILFYALTGHIYHVDSFDTIPELLKGSVFLSKLNLRTKKHTELLNSLCNILQSCLAAQREDRYLNCENLASDLATVTELCHTLRPRTTMKPVEAIQYNLYRDPLYVGPNNELHLLVVGFDATAQLFLDQYLPLAQCLPLMQSCTPTLNVTILCSKKQMTTYLKGRPAFPAFFTVKEMENQLADEYDSYGTIQFIPLQSDKTTSPVKEYSLYEQTARHQILSCTAQGQGYQILVSLGQDHINLAMARSLRQAIADLGCGEYTLIRYIWKGGRPTADGGLLPVAIREDMSDRSIEKEIERMAYNAHHLWDGTLESPSNNDTAFKKTYYHDSSVSNVTAVKWKLVSMHIDLNALGPEQAAKEFQDQLSADTDLLLFDRLIWNEHRRWVAEKICNGWRSLDPADYPLHGNRLKNEKKHGCIQHSGPNHKLKKLTDLYGVHAVWDAANQSSELKGEIGKLDDLDLFSLGLHRKKLAAIAEMKRKGYKPWSEYQAKLRRNLANTGLAWQLFCEWEACVEELWTYEQGNLSRQKKLYRLLCNAVRDTCRKPGTQDQSEEEILLDKWQYDLQPVLECLSCKDYKENDASLTRNIPFILLYDNTLQMVIPFVEGYSVDSILTNAAAALAGWPRKLLYLYYVREPKALATLEKALTSLENLLAHKKLQSTAEMLLLYAPFLQDAVGRLETVWRSSTSPHYITVRPQLVTSLQDAVARIQKELTVYEKFGPVALEQNHTPLSYLLESAGLHARFGGFCFDQKTQKFRGNKALETIPFSNFVSIENVIRIHGGLCNNKARPAFFRIYNDLWNIYKKNSAAWKTLCQCAHPSKEGSAALISAYDENGNKVLARFDGSGGTWSDPFNCIIDTSYTTTASRLISILCNWGLLEQIQDPCPIEKGGRNQTTYLFRTRENHKKIVQELFDPKSELWATGLLQQRTFGSDLHLLLLQDPFIWVNKKAPQEAKDLVDQLIQKGYLQYTDETAGTSDRYDGYRCEHLALKQLLLIEGKLLEIYVYHKLRASGHFDDVASSYEVQWESGGSDLTVLNEFDVLVTKGYQIAAIECKATQTLLSEFYFKLKALTEYFGGQNASSILVNFSDGNSRKLRTNEDIDRLRGEKLGVHLITNRSSEGSDIFDIIDQRICDILKTTD